MIPTFSKEIKLYFQNIPVKFWFQNVPQVL
jgi:hypothetical protein